jgi:hypothetical protein
MVYYFRKDIEDDSDYRRNDAGDDRGVDSDSKGNHCDILSRGRRGDNGDLRGFSGSTNNSARSVVVVE